MVQLDLASSMHRHSLRLRGAALAATRRCLSSVGDRRSPATRRVEHVAEALRLVRAFSAARFDEKVDLAIRLNVDAKRTDERVRGTVLLPHGTGKTVRVAVFARGALADEAREAGADVIGAEELVEEVMQGRLDFDRVLATPDVLPVLARAARVLGPKGLMPNPKRGSVVTDVAEAVQRAKGGEVEFKAQKEGIVHAVAGRVSFPIEHLTKNIQEIMCACAARPSPICLRDHALSVLPHTISCAGASCWRHAPCASVGKRRRLFI